jgi:hypothetical protein
VMTWNEVSNQLWHPKWTPNHSSTITATATKKRSNWSGGMRDNKCAHTSIINTGGPQPQIHHTETVAPQLTAHHHQPREKVPQHHCMTNK